MAFAVTAKGQDENVVSTHLFFRLLTKLSMVISGIRMKSPSPTVVWSAITAAAIHCSLSTSKHNCQLSLKDCTLKAETALGAVPPGLEPWQLLGRVAAATIQPALTGEPHRRFNRHDPALNIFIIVMF